MAVGLISSPTRWLLRQVVTPTFMQNVMDTINNMYAYKGATFSLFLGPSYMNSQSGEWTFDQVTGAGDKRTRFLSTAASDIIACDISLPYKTSGTVGYRLTSVTAQTAAGGGSNMSMRLWRNTTGGVSVQVGATISGTSTLALSSLTTVATAGEQLNVQITAGQAADQIYGVLVTYDLATIV